PLVGHVHRGANQLDEIAGVVEHRVTHRILIADAAVGTDDARAEMIRRAFTDRLLKGGRNVCAVVGMNAVDPELQGAGVFAWLDTVDPLELRRGLDGVRRRIIAPAAGMADTLHFEEKPLAFAE